MQTEAIGCGRELQAGQLWQIEHGYIQIVEVGKRVVYYKALRQPSQRAAATRMIGLGALLKYLTHSEGQLLRQHAAA